MRNRSTVSLDYRLAVQPGIRACPLDDLRPYVCAERGKGRTWSQIAKATGRARADLERKFGREFA